MRPHERYKRRERGRKEVPVRVGKAKGRLDSASKTIAVEIERSRRYQWAVNKLLKSRRKHKIMRVPKSKMSLARNAVQRALNRSRMQDPRVTITSLNKKSRTTVRKRRR